MLSETTSKARIKSWWATYVNPTVPASSYPDHRENENTFLGWYATAWTMCMFGMACDPAHDGSLQDADEETHAWKIVAVCFYVLAMILMATGAIRYFRQQYALTQGMVLTGGVEVFIASVAVVFAVAAFMAPVIRYAVVES